MFYSIISLLYSDPVGLVLFEGLEDLRVDIVLVLLWHDPELVIGLPGKVLDVEVVFLLPVLQSRIFLEGYFHSKDVCGELVSVSNADVIDIALDITGGGLEEELLE